MFKTQVEPRAAGEWFHCQVLSPTIMVDKALLLDEFEDSAEA